MSIAIAITTYQRPRLLARLLESIRVQEAEPALASSLHVVVVDNDAAAPARPLVDTARPGFPFPLHYSVEPVRSISLARNHGVRMALELGARFVAFIDDDEEASPGWIAELARVQRECRADVVWGRVVPRLPEGTPRWVARGGFFDRGSYPTGKRMTVAETANALVAAHLLSAPEGPFDPRFGISGGGDSHFFRRVVDAGGTIVWAHDAVVFETVPVERANARWILRRAFRNGNGSVYVERAVSPARRWLPPRLARATGRIALGMVMLPAAPLRGRALAVAALRNIAIGLGAYSGILGYRYVAYRQVDGS
ncbi:MAG TPA: glycosyltransferase family 2 protein [Longimicrobium sp.]